MINMQANLFTEYCYVYFFI